MSAYNFNAGKNVVDINENNAYISKVISSRHHHFKPESKTGLKLQRTRHTGLHIIKYCCVPQTHVTPFNSSISSSAR
jgi:hypothetical protein